MPSGDKIADDLARLFSNMLGIAQGTKAEAEAAFKSWCERVLAKHELVTRSEFDAFKAMVVKLGDENDALKARITTLEEALDAKTSLKKS